MEGVPGRREVGVLPERVEQATFARAQARQEEAEEQEKGEGLSHRGHRSRSFRRSAAISSRGVP